MESITLPSICTNAGRLIRVRRQLSKTMAHRLSEAATEGDLQGEFGLSEEFAREIHFLGVRAERERRGLIWLIGKIREILKATGGSAAY